MAEIAPKLEQLFGAWKPGDVPAKNIAHRRRTRRTTTLYLIDRPGAIQSLIFAGEARAAEGEPRRHRHSRR